MTREIDLVEFVDSVADDLMASKNIPIEVRLSMLSLIALITLVVSKLPDKKITVQVEGVEFIPAPAGDSQPVPVVSSGLEVPAVLEPGAAADTEVYKTPGLVQPVERDAG